MYIFALTRIKSVLYNNVMGIFSRRKAKNNAAPTPPERISYEDFTRFLIGRSEYNERNLSGVYQCIALISNTISKLPFFVIDRKTKKEVDSDIEFLLNMKPNEDMNAAVFKETIAINLLTSGNSFVLPHRRRGGIEIEWLEILDPALVGVNKDTNTGRVVYVYSDKGSKKVLRYDEIVHLKINPSKDGLVGMSPLTYARLTTSVGLKQEKFQESFYDNGGRPDGVLKTAADLSNKKEKFTMPDGSEKEMSLKDFMKYAWAEAHKGTNKQFNVAVLDNGLDYAPIPQISPADMDFVNSKNSTIEDICRYFNVPPYKLGVGKQTYTNNEQASIEYITNTIVPLVTQIEEELSLKLLTYAELKKGYRIKCNVEAELRGDSKTRSGWYKDMQYVGAYSVNEIRAYEDLPEIENGDARLVGANSTPLNLIVKGQTVPKNGDNNGDNTAADSTADNAADKTAQNKKKKGGKRE